MTTLTWEGRTFGGLGADVYLGEQGIVGVGAATRQTTMTDRQRGGAAGGTSRALSRSVRAEAWIDGVADPTMLAAVVASMHERYDPSDVSPLLLEGFPLWPTQRVRLYVRPEACDPGMDRMGADFGVPSFSLEWLADDPTFYVDDTGVDADDGRTMVTRAAASSHSFTATNTGTKTTDSGRAYTFQLTASGSVSNPWIEVAGRRVTFLTAMTGGQVLAVDEDRMTTLGSTYIGGLATTTGQRGPWWPVLDPGDNTVLIGAASGSFAVAWQHRGTS